MRYVSHNHIIVKVCFSLYQTHTQKTPHFRYLQYNNKIIKMIPNSSYIPTAKLTYFRDILFIGQLRKRAVHKWYWECEAARLSVTHINVYWRDEILSIDQRTVYILNYNNFTPEKIVQKLNSYFFSAQYHPRARIPLCATKLYE